MNINWISLGKGIVSLVASAGVSTVVTNMVKATTPETTKTVEKVMVVVGGFVLSSMVSTAASRYVSNELDSLFPSNQNAASTEPGK